MNTGTKLVRDVMSCEVATVGRNDSLLAADDLMRLGRIRHVPVLDDQGQLAGILSQRDLFHGGLLRALGHGSHARQEALTSLVAKEVMKTDLLTTTPNTPLRSAAELMLERKVGCLLVVEDAKLVGILTESDFVKLALES
jgi:CBS domain-containing protein